MASNNRINSHNSIYTANDETTYQTDLPNSIQSSDVCIYKPRLIVNFLLLFLVIQNFQKFKFFDHFKINLNLLISVLFKLLYLLSLNFKSNKFFKHFLLNLNSIISHWCYIVPRKGNKAKPILLLSIFRKKINMCNESWLHVFLSIETRVIINCKWIKNSCCTCEC